MSIKKSAPHSRKRYRDAMKLVRSLQEAAQAAWFPNEAFSETKAWAMKSGFVCVDAVTIDEAESPEFIEAVRAKSVGNANAPKPNDLYIWCMSFGYIDDVKRSMARNEIDAAMYELTAAAALAGIASERATLAGGVRLRIIELARMAANIRHESTRALRSKVEAWYVANRDKYRSMDAAAEAATGEFPVAFRTARKYIGEFQKRLRSARKA